MQQRQTLAPVSGPSSSHGGGLKDKIAQFEQKGGVPVPRGSFGLGAPPISDNIQARRKGELYGNRIPGVVRSTTFSRPSSPLLNGTPERRNRSLSEDYDAGSPEASPTYVPSDSSGELLPSPQSPSFPYTTTGKDHPPPYSSSFSPRRASFANALEIARRAESASPVGHDILEKSMPRPVSPFLVQRLPPSMLSEDEEVRFTPKGTLSRRESLVTSGSPPGVYHTTIFTTERSEPERSLSLEDEPNQTTIRDESQVPLSVSLLPPESQEVTRMSFEEMMAEDGEESTPADEELGQLPSNEHVEETIDADEANSQSSDALNVEEIEDSKIRNRTSAAPEITVMSFDDTSSLRNSLENDVGNIPFTEIAEKTTLVDNSDHVTSLYPAEEPSLEPEREIWTPVLPSTPEVNDPPRFALHGVRNQTIGGSEIPVDPTILTLVISNDEVDFQTETPFPPDRNVIEAEESQILSSSPVDVLEDDADESLILEQSTWRDRPPNITVRPVDLSDKFEIVDPIAPHTSEIEESNVVTTSDAPATPVSHENPPAIAKSPQTPSLLPSPLFSPSPSLTFEHAYMDPDSPLLRRANSEIKIRRASHAAGRTGSVHTYGSLSPQDSEFESDFGTISFHTYSRSYSHLATYRSTDVEADLESPSVQLGSKPSSFSAVVHKKVTELPSTSTSHLLPPTPQTARGRLTTTVNMEPESPGYGELAELLKEAAKLEKRLLEGDIPDEHRAAARRSLAMSKYTAAQYLRPKSTGKGAELPRPSYHRASSSPSAVKTILRSRSGDTPSSMRSSSWRLTPIREPPSPRQVLAPTGTYTTVEAPQKPLPKSPRSRYLPNFRRLTSHSTPPMPGAYPRESSSISSEVSSEDSMHGDRDGGKGGRKEGDHQSGLTLGIAWPSMPMKRNGGGIASFAERIWKRGRSKSATSMTEVSGRY